MSADLTKFFNTTDKEVIFTGDQLVAHVPERYENYELLEFEENNVVTFGVFDMTINGVLEHGLLLPSILYLTPSNIEKVTNSEGTVVYDLTFQKNDTFIATTTYVKMDSLVYVAFLEFIQLGKLPKFLNYDQAAFLMARLSKICGLRFDVNHAIVEIMLAHLFRDAKDPNIPYRRTNYKDPPKFIPLQQVSYGATSTTSKLLGSYLTDGLRSALVNQNDVNYEFEAIIGS
jgi:hypothetical protein